MRNDGGEREGSVQFSATESAQRISPEAVQRLHATCGQEVMAFLIGVLKDVNAAQDVSQIAFRKLLEAGHTAQQETIKGWLFKVALHEALVYRRQDSRRERHQREYSRQVETVVARSVEESFVELEDVTRVKELISRLPRDQQQVLRDRVYHQKTFAVIADELNLPLGTVLTRMRSAIEKIRKWFGEDTSKSPENRRDTNRE